jgi:hypothetical protein
VPATVAALRTSPVKGLAQQSVASLVLDADGVRDDRRFAVVDETGLARYTAQLRPLAGTTAVWDPQHDVLELRFPDGESVSAPVEDGEPIAAHGYARRPMPGRLVEGPFADALSARLRRPVKLVRLPIGVGGPGQVTILSLATVERVAQELGIEALDPRRFKTTIELDGPAAHEEDAWGGRELVIGDARLRVGGQIGRCVLTTYDPDRLRRDLDVLGALLAYRPRLPSGEPPLGMYATVVSPGRIAVGDDVQVYDS